MDSPGPDPRHARLVVVVLDEPRPTLPTTTGYVALALAARTVEGATGLVRRGLSLVEPARGAATAAAALLPRPEWLASLQAEGATRADTMRTALDRWATVALETVADRVLVRLDVAALVHRRVDVDAIVADAIEHADLDAAAARLDVEAVVDRLDLTRIVLDHVDLRAVVLAVLDRLDLTRIVIDRVDLADVVAAAVARADLDAVVRRLDLTRIVLEQVDLDAVVAAALDRLDLVALANDVIDGVDLPEIIRESTGSMASETVRSARMQGIHADEAIDRVVDRLLLRRHRHDAESGGTAGGASGGNGTGPT